MKAQITSISSRRHNQGFSLVEVLISFVVMAVGLLALLSFHSTSQTNVAEAKVQAEAVALAEAKLQELESFLTIFDIRLDEGEGSDSPAGQLLTFARSWELEDDPVNSDLVIAEVTVSWTDRDGNQQSVILNSAINRREPSESVTNFLEVAMNAVSGGSGNTGSWGDPGTDPSDPNDPTDPTDPGTDPVPDPDPDPQPNPDPVYFSLTITGSVNVGNGAQFNGVTPSNSNYSVTCSNTSSSYTCTATAIPEGESLTFKLTFLTNKVVCVPSSGYYQFNNISSDISSGYNAVIRNKAKDC